ncbi:MAG: electron transport protein SCO1/SenC [Myxococcales bacterium]|nr:electron transport protein SCO1/SenC [Myxococcales bacterium]
MGHATSSSTISGRKLLIGLLLVFLFAVVPGVVIPTLVCRKDAVVLPDLGTVPAFALTDERDLVFTEDGLRGHPTIVNFVFTRCDTICPIVSAKMEKVQHRLSDRRAESIKLVSISVDPAYDTPARLATYAERFHARPDKWRFLTGPVDKVRALVEGPFMNSMITEGLTPSGAPAISHSGYFVLVDANLMIRGVYDSGDIKKLDEMMMHARHLARTTRSYKFGGT